MAKRVNNMNQLQKVLIPAVSWANQGLHGGTIEGNNTPHVWDDTVKNTVGNGELLRLAVDYLVVT